MTVAFPLLPDHALLRRAESLHMERRDDRVLAIEPTRPAAALLERAALRFLTELSRPRRLGEMLPLATAAGMAPEDLRRLLTRLHQDGLVSVNGRFSSLPPAAGRSSERLVVFHLDDGCSPACSSCTRHAREHPPSSVDLGRWRSILATSLEPADAPLRVLLSGGEPLRSPDVVRQIVAHGTALAGERGADVRFLVESRADGLDDETIDFLACHGVDLGLVLDAPVGNLAAPRDDTLAGTAESRISPETFHAALSRGLSVVPMVFVRSAPEFLAAFQDLVAMGFRSFRMSIAPDRIDPGTGPASAPTPEAFVAGFMEMVRAAVEFTHGHGAHLALSPLDSLLARLLPGSPGPPAVARVRRYDPTGAPRVAEVHGADVLRQDGTEDPEESVATLLSAHPRCSRCPVRGWCQGEPRLDRHTPAARQEFLCRFHQVVHQELLWEIHAEGSWFGRLSSGHNGPGGMRG